VNILEVIYTRRSIRSFKKQRLDDDILKLILKAGFQAPSAMNLQPWHFVVVRNEEMLKKIAEKHHYADMLPNTAFCIVVCGDKKIQKKLGFLIEDCSAAIENMLLAAHGLGFGAVWLSMYPIKSRYKPIAKMLNIPSKVIPVGMVALGVKAEEKPFENRYKEEKVHYEKW